MRYEIAVAAFVIMVAGCASDSTPQEQAGATMEDAGGDTRTDTSLMDAPDPEPDVSEGGDAAQDALDAHDAEPDSTADVTPDVSAPDVGTAPCALDGVEVEDGESEVFHLFESVPLGGSCEATTQVRTCEDGTFDGDARFAYASCAVDTVLELFVEVGGDDAADGRSPETALGSVARALEVARAFEGRATQAIVRLGEGDHAQEGELLLDAGVEIVGLGPDLTSLRCRIVRTEACVRVEASDVVVRDMHIDVNLIHRLNDGIVSGGRGEFGTGVTIGRYLSPRPHPRVTHVRLSDLRISRSGFVAAAMTVVGNVDDVEIGDIELLDKHSTAFISHWGGHSASPLPAPYGLLDPDYDLYETYHPNGIWLHDVTVEASDRFLALSSSYDITAERFTGETGELMLVLPGDEAENYAVEEDRGAINQGITVSDMTFGLRVSRSVDNDYVVRMTSKGTSKIHYVGDVGVATYLDLRDVLVEDVTVTGVRVAGSNAAETAELERHQYRFGINTLGSRGEGIVFRNVDLGEVGAPEFDHPERGVLPTYSVYVRDATGITFESITGGARYGLGIIDSEGIVVQNSLLRHDGTDPEGGTRYGAFIQDTGAGVFTTGGLSLTGVTLDGFDVGVRYAGGVSCDVFETLDVTLVGVDIDERDGDCLP